MQSRNFPARAGVAMLRAFVCSAAALSLGAIAPAAADPAVTLSPAVNHPDSKVTVSGSGFGPFKGVDIYWDTADELLVTTDGGGAFSKKSIPVPADALPGQHWVTVLERDNGTGTQKAFTVRTDWASFGFNAKNKRFNPYENVISPKNVNLLEEAWNFPTNNSIYSSPAVAGGTVYIGSLDGNLYALNAATGTKKWLYATGGSVESSPAVSGNVVYAGSDDGKLYALTTAGALKWVFTPPAWATSPVYSSPTVANGVVYIGLGSNGLYAVNASTGALKWKVVGASSVQSTPAVAGGLVFWGDDDGNVHAYDLASHAVAWTDSAASPVRSSATITNGNVFFSTEAGGEEEYETYGKYLGPWFGGRVAGAAAAYDSVYATADQCLCSIPLHSDGNAIAYEPTASFTAAPAIANGIVYAGDSDGMLHAADASTGKGLWSARTNNILYSSPAVSDGMVFVGSFDGRVYAYALNGGANAAYHRATTPPAFATLHPDFRLKPVTH